MMTTRALLLSLVMVVASFGCADRDTISLDDEVGEDEDPFEPGESYASCNAAGECFNDWCLRPLDEPGFCTQACDPATPETCPDPGVGTATPVCVVVGQDAACALDCGGERDCPEGMRCEQVDVEGSARSICF
ncbi:hypothetical protein G6O69_11010 [Pseudenhygromyxa sp. WMMC2535]|uniref:hypothetical protein n=1 Tax=Pseudenhygromyxa sp. WMMC2535 TaxID=2712867 RepID=UPI001558234D|nr:hypothetical protein [Pseudenhygromyxa sp. WMMC2535]NVB38360.1 hypothetical protein [Pseudenhygromyxa sp. WMMC2535]